MAKNDVINIFIVEDDAVFALALQRDIEMVFNDRPIKVQTFSTGEELMKRFRMQPPRVVILDYYLNSKNPDAMDGIKVLDWIKSERAGTDVIMLTGEDNLKVALESFKHGAFDYVVKTETKFKRINNTLANLFMMFDARNDAYRYKQMGIGLTFSISMIVIIVIIIRIFNPYMLS